MVSSTQGEVYVAYTTLWSGAGKYSVFQIDAGKLVPLFDVAGAGGRASLDEDGNFIIGAGMRKVDLHGQPVPGSAPLSVPTLRAVPTTYTGAVILTKGALWDMGNYGFVGRFTRDGKAAPGAVSQWRPGLQYVAQIADTPEGELYLKSSDALYVAEMAEGRLKLLKRFGSLPEVRALAITDNGYLGVGSNRPGCWLWWNFDEDAAAAAPVKSEFPGPIAQGYNDGNAALTLTSDPNYFPLEYRGPGLGGFDLMRYKPEPLIDDLDQDAVASGSYDSPLIAIAHVGDNYFTLTAKGTILHIASDWKTLASVDAGNTTTSIAALGANILLAAVGHQDTGL